MMFRFPSREIVEGLRIGFPVGARVELICMHDPFSALAPGEQGTVVAVDDIGTIHVSWDCGSSLGVAYGEDCCRRI